MENMILRNLDRLEKLEKEYGMIGTVIGVALILLVLALMIFGIKIVLTVGFETLDSILRKFFDIKLF